MTLSVIFNHSIAVTGSFAIPFTAYFSFRTMRVVQRRLGDKHYLDENWSKAVDPSSFKTNGVAQSPELCVKRAASFLPRCGGRAQRRKPQSLHRRIEQAPHNQGLAH
ncbi:uncharacterized protein BCR38DRAFT_421100 [Pseudomassariella vexata]|uniref:Uncharacterized protein n=1 Tax=Pseudomassariella vexata TaxID=1141098 RepID=A0A1Y2EEX9_9PEZI|nr:uncharacterized protein BCR38DRAFT_421100 [Pseudomassariella vexata]ORY70138.1 hypothetical protein BCR38DRAFT_421100 [Pseudomassariella vexata]